MTISHAILSKTLALLAVSLVARGSEAPPQNTESETPLDSYQTLDPWFLQGRQALEQRRALTVNDHRARNVILFIGDGMGISTSTAARIFAGQRDANAAIGRYPGEENYLSFERFPYTALVKTYTTNAQISDSAGTASAMATGVKTRSGVLSVASAQPRGVCPGTRKQAMRTILELAEDQGLSTGVVTTATLTHATPAAFYAHSPERDWQHDGLMPAGTDPNECPDIARQLLEFRGGNGLEVALGGGRAYFRPAGSPDPEYPSVTGLRQDGRDLSAEWLARRPDSQYVWGRDQLRSIDVSAVNHLLGLFEPESMKYEVDRSREPDSDPSLVEMTQTAIGILSRNPNGFFLMVEAGRIDHGHHEGNAYRALADVRELSLAVAAALERVDTSETLVLVTADHSHVLSIAGYPSRGNDILGLVRGNNELGNPTGLPVLALDGKPYTTLGYLNGPGAWSSRNPGGRPKLTDIDTAHPDYLQQAAVALGSESHAGEDVALYAIGPRAHLVGGLIEQNVIFHLMVHALGME